MEDQRAEELWYENEYGRYPVSILEPSYPFSPYPSFCGCFTPWQTDVKQDCYFCHEEHHMGATIPTCSYHNDGFGNCPCKGCKKYISKSDAYKLIVEKVSGTNE